MPKNLEFGIQTNGIKHSHGDLMPDIDTRFQMVKKTCLFDYVDKTKPQQHKATAYTRFPC